MLDRSRPARHLDLEGAYNLRDLGGYPTVDGKTTRWGSILRSGGMHLLSPSSQAALVDYGVRAIIDLRRDSELADTPNVFASSDRVAYLHQDIMGDRLSPNRSESPEYRDPARWWRAHYTQMLDHRRPRICRTLATLADPSRRPAVFHCAAGKDRTGVVAALLLSLAGVSPETIAMDYTLSADLLLVRFPEGVPPDVDPDTLAVEDYRHEHCPAEAMLATLEHLRDSYGSAEEYALGGGMSREQVEALRNALVE